MRSVIIAFPDLELARKLRALFNSRSLPVQGVCQTGAQALQMASLNPGGGVIICPFRFTDMSAQEVMNLVSEAYDMLVLVTPRQVGAINGEGIFTLTQPFNGQILLDNTQQLMQTRQTTAGALPTGRAIHGSHGGPGSYGDNGGSGRHGGPGDSNDQGGPGRPREPDRTGRAADHAAAGPPAHGRNSNEQHIIEQAKYLLMNRKHLTEAEAHRYLQKRSMESGIRMIDLARRIIG